MYVGIDLGGTNIAVGLVAENYEIIAKGSVPTGRERTFSAIMQDTAELIRNLCIKANKKEEEIQGIGMGAPGVIDVENKTIVRSSNFPQVRRANVEAALHAYFPHVPIYVENDANAAAYGEFLNGAARGFGTALMVTLGTGVGGGIIMNNQIYAGFNHAGGEIGHMVISMDGPVCGCGQKGCFETFASATALIRQTAETIPSYPDSIIHDLIDHNPQNINGKIAFDAAKQGDFAGEQIVARYVEYLSIGLLNLIHILQPEAIVIGGGICKEGEYLLSKLRAYIEKHHYTNDIPTAKIVTATLGNDAGILGAAMLWKQS